MRSVENRYSKYENLKDLLDNDENISKIINLTELKRSRYFSP